MSLQCRQLRMNESGEELCLCGRWEDYARVDGGWAAVDMGPQWGSAGGRRCEDVAARITEAHSRMCMLCQARPMDECDQHAHGRLLTVRGRPEQGLERGPVRCCDIWDTTHTRCTCPTCTIGSERSCFRKCKCHCDGCAVGSLLSIRRLNALIDILQVQS